MKAVTKKQQEILDFIVAFCDEHSYTPTIREIAANYNITVKAAFDHVNALKKKGKITSEKGRLRTLKIVKNKEAVNEKFLDIPILGEVSAGTGILSEEDIRGFVPVHSSILKKNCEYFAVKVCGDSMNGIGIVDGDTAVIEKQQTAKNGDIVVALINERYVLKKYYRQISNIKLCSENPLYYPIYTDNIRILGHLACVFRVY
ncbi:MAG: transcriptional repressor LexA [Termitinemataceae bacterium]|nr:MAG: transcriptional repressor LexA [Termitinemataceae bacterium]